MEYFIAFIICVGAIGGGIAWCDYIAKSATANHNLTLREWLGFWDSSTG